MRYVTLKGQSPPSECNWPNDRKVLKSFLDIYKILVQTLQILR